MKNTERRVKPDPQEATRASQAAYRARMAEVVGLMEELWYLRRRRELGPASGLAPLTSDKWRELGVMLRQMIHEEELAASAVSAARRAATEQTLPGLSTCHIRPRPESQDVSSSQEPNVRSAAARKRNGVARKR